MSMRRPNGGFISAFYDPLKVPNAPTIGTATAGDASVSITFTAPTNIGSSAITGYIATAYDSSGNTVSATGSASPINITGLTNGTAYTIKVAATNSFGTGPLSSASSSVSPVAPPTVIGQAYGGGYYAGKISTTANGVATHYLIVADKAVGEVYGRTWGTYGATTGVTSVINGPTNSAALAALGAAYQAATFCEGLNSGGYTDWYLPAKNELEVCYFFLKPSTTTNSVGTYSGSNANAVSPEPLNTNYSSGTPAQTSATNFRSGASSQEFDSGVSFYWSSSESNSTGARGQYFHNGLQGDQGKNSTSRWTRAIRRIAI